MGSPKSPSVRRYEVLKMDKNGEWQPKVASLKSLRSKLRSREGSPIRSPQMTNGHYRTRSADLSSVIDRKYIASNSLSPRVTSPIGRPPTPPRRNRPTSPMGYAVCCLLTGIFVYVFV